MGASSLHTCRLRNVEESVEATVPSHWRRGLFGSSTGCDASGTCVSATHDVDLLLVYPPGEEVGALRARTRLVTTLSRYGLNADICLLSVEECASTGFWEHEHVVDLKGFLEDCGFPRRQ